MQICTQYLQPQGHDSRVSDSLICMLQYLYAQYEPTIFYVTIWPLGTASHMVARFVFCPEQCSEVMNISIPCTVQELYE